MLIDLETPVVPIHIHPHAFVVLMDLPTWGRLAVLEMQSIESHVGPHTEQSNHSPSHACREEGRWGCLVWWCGGVVWVRKEGGGEGGREGGREGCGNPPASIKRHAPTPNLTTRTVSFW